MREQKYTVKEIAFALGYASPNMQAAVDLANHFAKVVEGLKLSRFEDGLNG